MSHGANLFLFILYLVSTQQDNLDSAPYYHLYFHQGSSFPFLPLLGLQSPMKMCRKRIILHKQMYIAFGKDIDMTGKEQFNVDYSQANQLDSSS